MGFGAEMEMKMYNGEDMGDDEEIDENSPGVIVIETLSNMRTVASLTLEKDRAHEYDRALRGEIHRPLRTNAVKGTFASRDMKRDWKCTRAHLHTT